MSESEFVTIGQPPTCHGHGVMRLQGFDDADTLVTWVCDTCGAVDELARIPTGTLCTCTVITGGALSPSKGCPIHWE